MTKIDVDEEIKELRGHFPDASKSDFYELDNGNTGVMLQIATKEQYSLGIFEILLEFPPGYPDVPPSAWVCSPEIDESCPHTYGNKNGQTKICFTADGKWGPQYTSFDAVTMVKSWIFGYCQWKQTGEWGWDGAGSIDI